MTASDKPELCGSDPKSTLTYNDFGEGECMCLKSPPHARLDDDPDKQCFELYLQGPCNRREILGKSHYLSSKKKINFKLIFQRFLPILRCLNVSPILVFIQASS